MSPYTLTHIIYGLIALALVSVAIYFTMYSRKQKAELQKAERGGAHPNSVAESILVAQEQTKKDAGTK